MDPIEETQCLINGLGELLDKEIEEIFKNLDGVSIKEIKVLFNSNKFELNETKRTVVELLEKKLSQKINDHNFVI